MGKKIRHGGLVHSLVHVTSTNVHLKLLTYILPHERTFASAPTCEPRRGGRDLAQGGAKRNPGLTQTSIQIHSNPGGVVAEYGKGGLKLLTYILPHERTFAPAPTCEPRRGGRDLAQGGAKRNPGLTQTPIQIHSNPGGVEAEYGKGGL